MRYTTSFPDGSGMNLTKAMCASKVRKITPPEGWSIKSTYHWQRKLNGTLLDFWPSKDKWRHNGKTYFGDVDKYIEFHLKPTTKGSKP